MIDALLPYIQFTYTARIHSAFFVPYSGTRLVNHSKLFNVHHLAHDGAD